MLLEFDLLDKEKLKKLASDTRRLEVLNTFLNSSSYERFKDSDGYDSYVNPLPEEDHFKTLFDEWMTNNLNNLKEFVSTKYRLMQQECSRNILQLTKELFIDGRPEDSGEWISREGSRGIIAPGDDIQVIFKDGTVKTGKAREFSFNGRAENPIERVRKLYVSIF